MADQEIPSPGEHEARVHEAFDAFHEKVGARLDGDARESLDRIREAAADRDPERMREHMTQVQEEHGWLYRELAQHPAIANLLDELALWGF
ncbi:MAG TPA: hypothetical protein VKG01_04015 [Thermoanaerobaculia bacterium]|nr:hypothetical protein [Thermoanaerobaculia bacterium]